MKSIVWIASFIRSFFRRDRNIWLYADGELRSAIHLFKYASARRSERHVYLTRDQKQLKQLVDEGYDAVLTDSVEGYRLMAQAGVVVNNKSSLNDYSKHLVRGAKLVNLFHGIPLKRIGLAQPQAATKSVYRKRRNRARIAQRYSEYQFLCATSEFVATLFSASFGKNVKEFPIVGEPRNDYLISNSGCRDHIANLFKRELLDHEKVICYMPTWRDYGDWDSELDFEALAKFLEKEQLLFVLRPHPNDKQWVSYRPVSDRIVIDNKGIIDDAYDLLIGTDVLISDYSSVFFEFLILGKPVINYLPDVEKYKAGRPFMFNLDVESPVEPIFSFDILLAELKGAISSDWSPSPQYARAMNRFHSVKGAISSELVCNEIDKLFVETAKVSKEAELT